MHVFKTLPFKMSDIVFNLGEIIQPRALATFATAPASNLHAEEKQKESQMRIKKTGSERRRTVIDHQPKQLDHQVEAVACHQ